LAVGGPVRAFAGQYIANNTAAFVATAQKIGATDESASIKISVWLKPRNRAQMDALAQELYDPSSPNYRHWLTRQEVAQRFAPTAAEAQVVKAFLEFHQLTVSRIGPDNFYVRASGTIAQVEQAFAVQIDNYRTNGQTVRANAADPYVEGPAAALIQAVSGLDDVAFQNADVLRPSVVSSQGLAIAQQGIAPASSRSTTSGFQSRCFPGTVVEHRTTYGGYPKATYSGNEYAPGSGGGCAYAPADIRAAYNLDALYAEGYDGKGQTIVLIEDCGSPTLLDDANAFSERFGLPLLTASNFSITSMGPSACTGYYPNIDADVEWAHAIAPGAALAVVYSVTNGPQDVDDAMFYALNYGLGTVICNDNGVPEFLLPETEAQNENLISEIAALEGISANYPGAVAGGVFFFESPVVPADGPYATGIGGISLALGANGSIAFETAWEDHVSEVLGQGTIYDPAVEPVLGGYLGGGVGGPSAYFAKPSFQKGVAGTQRGEPDFSWVADPYTGLIAAATTANQEPPQSWFAVGGTGVATSMFSALWAIANQKAGIALGQAAPYLYSMPATAVTDIVPYSSTKDVVATVRETSSSSTTFDAAQTLLLPPYTAQFGPFYSALWENPDGEENTSLVLSFGGDFLNKVAVGWDEVTGVGAPRDAKAFVDWLGGNKR
jgi:subtilase family serine protease